MKIAVPTRGTSIDDHFGHCEYFTVYTAEQDRITNREVVPSPVGCGCKSNIAEVLQQMGVTLMLAGGIGQGAVNVLGAYGIEVIRGCSGNTDELVSQYLKGNLISTGEVCGHHHGEHGHSCNHDH